MAQKEEIRLTEKEERLIKMIRELGFGELHIFCRRQSIRESRRN